MFVFLLLGRCKSRKRRCCCDVVGRCKTRKRRCRRTLQPSLPHEVIENVLSRLPVKDLLRLSVVCKQWEATISDPTFAQIHLHQYSKNPSSPNLLGWDNLGNFNGLHVAELRNNCIELVSTIEHSREYGLQYFKSTWCSCDGLYLMRTMKPIKLVLWNPSRRMYRELYFPHSDLVSYTTIRSMYYNPLMKDYRIVIGDLDRYDLYAVYSCRDDKWGDVKEVKGFLGGLYLEPEGISVSVNGSIYWLVVDFLDMGDDDELLVYKEVLCFDCKDETFRRLPLPYYKDLDEKYFQLTSFGDQLCLLVSNRELDTRQVEIMIINSGDEWMELEFKEECCLYDCGPPEPVCQLSDNEILFRDSGYMVYDKTKNTLVKILNNYPPAETNFYFPISKHAENLLLL